MSLEAAASIFLFFVQGMNMMGMLSYALRLIEESLVSKLMEAGCFRYGG